MVCLPIISVLLPGGVMFSKYAATLCGHGVNQHMYVADLPKL